MLSNVEQYRVVSILVASHKVWEIDPAIDGCHFGGGFVFSRTPWPLPVGVVFHARKVYIQNTRRLAFGQYGFITSV